MSDHFNFNEAFNSQTMRGRANVSDSVHGSTQDAPKYATETHR